MSKRLLTARLEVRLLSGEPQRRPRPMIGRVEAADREIADAVAAVEDEMLELLSRLVEAPIRLLESTDA